MDAATLSEEEHRLTSILAAWAAASVIAGGAAWAVGHKQQNPNLAGFGRQTLMWGVVDGAIAGAGMAGVRKRAPFATDDQAQAHRTKLRRILLINSAADVGYIAAGGAIMARARQSRRILAMNAGDGAAIALQGKFLLALDTVMAWRLRG